MENFLNRLDVCFYNALLTNKIDQKEKIINKVFTLIKYCRMTTDLINYLYTFNNDTFSQFIKTCEKPSLILLTYDLEAIGNAINIPSTMYLLFRNNSFYIDYKPISPNSNSSNSIHSEWGY